MRQIGVRIGDLIDVEIPRAGDMRAEKLRLAVLGLVRQVFRRVEHNQVWLAQFRGEPFGRDKRFHLTDPLRE